MSEPARRLNDAARVPDREIEASACDAPFSSADLDDIADCFERRTGRSAWVGYGFADRGEAGCGAIYLFSAGVEGGRLALRRTAAGHYELIGFNGALLWSGPRLKDFLEGLSPPR